MFCSFFSRHYQRYLLYPLLSMLVTLSICIGLPQLAQAIPWADVLIQGTQVYQLYNISPQEEVQLGKQINQELISSGKFQLYRHPDINRYVQQIGQRLVKHSNRPNIPYTFQVVKDESVNASATAGGFIYVNTGLLKAVDNEAQLASVLAHEIGHISSQHLVEQMRQAAITRGITTAVGLDRNTAIQIAVDLVLERPNNRQDEFEADLKGLQTLGRANYAQSAMISFMRKLLNSDSGPAFLSKHPATNKRITALQRAIDSQKANVGDGLDNSIYKAKIRPLNQA